MTREEAKNILISILHIDGAYMDYLDSEDVEAIKFLANDERPHGEWIEGVICHFCSECHNYALEDDNGEVLSYFCPNCGADMRKRGDRNEQTTD